MSRNKKILRVIRLVLIAVVVVMVLLFRRDHQQMTIPEPDQSLVPRFKGGTTVFVRPIDDDEPLERGAFVVYSMEKDGTLYKRFGRVRALPGDVVGARDGKLTVNDELIGPMPILGHPMGIVPSGTVLVLANNSIESTYPDSRQLGFIPRADIKAIITGGLAD